MTKFILDSGNPQEYQEIAGLAKEQGSDLWGSTTNPSLIAKQLVGKKVTKEEAFSLQKEIVQQILEIVPGAVSAEVYADESTTAQEMIEQGKDIASWHERVVVKLPTTLAGFHARTELRYNNIITNNTLVFSQEQIFAICLHEQIVQAHLSPTSPAYPPFISPFVGRLDDQGVNGMDLVKHGMKIKSLLKAPTWMLEASVRTLEHMKQGLSLGSELITAPAKIYREFFALTLEERHTPSNVTAQLQPIPDWWASTSHSDLLTLTTIEEFMEAIETKKLNIQHDLTDTGIKKFVEDWKSILAE